MIFRRRDLAGELVLSLRMRWNNMSKERRIGTQRNASRNAADGGLVAGKVFCTPLMEKTCAPLHNFEGAADFDCLSVRLAIRSALPMSLSVCASVVWRNIRSTFIERTRAQRRGGLAISVPAILCVKIISLVPVVLRDWGKEVRANRANWWGR